METQALQYGAEVDIQTRIKLELAAHPRVLTCCIVVGEDVRPVRTGATACEEILSIDDIGRRCNGVLGLYSIRIDIGDGDQRSHTVRTPAGSHVPIVECDRLTILLLRLLGDGRACIVERCIGIDVGTDVLVDAHVHVTTGIETVCKVVLGLAEVDEVTKAIVTHVAVELGAVVTTFNLHAGIRTVVSLRDIV